MSAMTAEPVANAFDVTTPSGRFKTYADYKMIVYPTHRSGASPERVYEATKRNATSAKLVPEGNGFTGAISGTPFPIPQSGVEVFWNHITRYRSVAAALLQEDWNGARVVELEGPRRYSAADIGRAFGAAFGREVRVEPVPRETWEQLFRSQGMKNPLPRIRMLDGFNEGWIDFERAGEHRQGAVTLDTVIGELIGKKEGGRGHRQVE